MKFSKNFQVLLVIVIASFNFFNKVNAVVRCSCPCQFGQVNGLSGTAQYREQCFNNNIFIASNSFACELAMSSCR